MRKYWQPFKIWYLKHPTWYGGTIGQEYVAYMKALAQKRSSSNERH